MAAGPVQAGGVVAAAPPGWDGRAAPGRPGTVVTPEAVVLDLRTASAASRAVARFLDLALALLSISVVSIPLQLLGATVAGAVDLVLGVFALFGYPAVMESLWKGRTLGKAALGLRVVTADGGPIGARQAIVRALLLPVDVVAGVESILLSPRDRRIGDVLAGTIVRRERRDRQAVTPIWIRPPWGLEPFAATLDASGLRPPEVLIIRSFLLRWGQLTPTARWPAGAALAGPIAVRLGHHVPPGLPPELYLQCLLAARQALDNGPALTVPAPPPGWTAPPAAGWGPPAPGGPSLAG
jgi:uncharacterized RDD family membrane protein YckC